MTDNVTQMHRPLTQQDWGFIFDVLEGTKLDVPRIRSEVARLQREAAKSERRAITFGDIVHTQGEEQEGMTLRDYFAAKAMQALTSNMDALRAHSQRLSYDETAEMAYEQADAMLESRDAYALNRSEAAIGH